MESKMNIRSRIDRVSQEARAATQPREPTRGNSRRGDRHRLVEEKERHPLIWSGVLHVNGYDAPIRVRNISATGAMVQTSSKVPVGAEAVLELSETLTVSATVGWAVGDQVGLRFHTPFDVTQLSRSTPEVAPQRWERPSYLNKAAETASPWDPKWQRISMSEIGQELDGFLKR